MQRIEPTSQLPIGPSVGRWTPPPSPARTPMSGRYCRLEPLDPDRHGDELAEALCTPGIDWIWTYLPYGPFSTTSDYRDWLRTNAQADDPLFYAILDRTTSRSMGLAAYLRITPASGCIEMGHLLFSPELQRTPIATEALFLLMQQAFELGYRRCEWKCDALNAKSRAAALRLGLSFEGIFRQATVYKGRSRDTAWFAAIDGDWPQIKQAFTKWLEPENFGADGMQRIALSSLTQRLLHQGLAAGG